MVCVLEAQRRWGRSLAVIVVVVVGGGGDGGSGVGRFKEFT